MAHSSKPRCIPTEDDILKMPFSCQNNIFFISHPCFTFVRINSNIWEIEKAHSARKESQHSVKMKSKSYLMFIALLQAASAGKIFTQRTSMLHLLHFPSGRGGPAERNVSPRVAVACHHRGHFGKVFRKTPPDGQRGLWTQSQLFFVKYVFEGI